MAFSTHLRTTLGRDVLGSGWLVGSRLDPYGMVKVLYVHTYESYLR